MAAQQLQLLSKCCKNNGRNYTVVMVVCQQGFAASALHVTSATWYRQSVSDGK